eukprot:2138729-Prymnesium_polylepis.2
MACTECSPVLRSCGAALARRLLVLFMFVGLLLTNILIAQLAKASASTSAGRRRRSTTCTSACSGSSTPSTCPRCRRPSRSSPVPFGRVTSCARCLACSRSRCAPTCTWPTLCSGARPRARIRSASWPSSYGKIPSCTRLSSRTVRAFACSPRAACGALAWGSCRLAVCERWAVVAAGRGAVGRQSLRRREGGGGAVLPASTVCHASLLMWSCATRP